ncbi:hypothetical protein ACLI4Q_16250 [Natrialbaceae archaeon A-CW1-1]
MTRKTIEKNVEVTDIETIEEELIFCDGCSEETGDYLELTDITRDQLLNLIYNEEEYSLEFDHDGITVTTTRDTIPTMEGRDLKQIAEKAEAFQFCPSCQQGIRDHGYLVDLALTEHEPAEDKADDLGPTDIAPIEHMTTLSRWGTRALVVWAFLFLMVPALDGIAPIWSMLALGIFVYGYYLTIETPRVYGMLE